MEKIKKINGIYTKESGLWIFQQHNMEGKGPFPNGIRITAPHTIEELDEELKKIKK